MKNKSHFVIGNWKLNPNSTQEASSLYQAIQVPEKLKGQIFICPPAIYLSDLQHNQKSNSPQLCAQNLSQYNAGAYTGEISAAMLANAKITHTLIGHSERRSLFAESNDIVSEKVKAALEQKITPIICVGETEAERTAHQTDEVIQSQLTALKAVLAGCTENICFAYEPVWAIGTGKTCSAEEANRVCALIERFWTEKIEASFGFSVLYGGSVKANNAPELLAQQSIGGVLVGGASLIISEFQGIIAAAANAQDANAPLGQQVLR